MPYTFTQTDTPMGQPGKKCPRCHATFFCDVREGCWCETVPLDQETLKFLRTNYIDCLCPACLKQFQNHKN